MTKIILVTGASRSGKSDYALSLAEKISVNRLFLATCPSVDSELSDRVSLHKKEREGRGWDTLEEELLLERAFQQPSDYNLVLVDCLTLWINNLIFNAPSDQDFSKEWLITQIDTWFTHVLEFSGTVVFVTGEVGAGIVPENPMSRLYRDLVGWCNQIIAQRSNEVFLVSCGIPLQLK